MDLDVLAQYLVYFFQEQILAFLKSRCIIGRWKTSHLVFWENYKCSDLIWLMEQNHIIQRRKHDYFSELTDRFVLVLSRNSFDFVQFHRKHVKSMHVDLWMFWSIVYWVIWDSLCKDHKACVSAGPSVSQWFVFVWDMCNEILNYPASSAPLAEWLSMLKTVQYFCANRDTFIFRIHRW